MEVLQVDHYYPFGMTLAGATSVPTPAEKNQYTFTGKEVQDEMELGWIDFGARMYDASIGRWNGVDALAEKYIVWSPFNYVMGNPIIFIDPDGRSVGIIVGENGRIYGDDGKKDDQVYVVPNSTGRQLKRKKISTDDALKSTVVQTTMPVLQEAENVLIRTEENGGNREESSVVTKTGEVTQGEPGPELQPGEESAKSSLPNVKGNDNTSIHSHTINYTESSDRLVVSSSSALTPGPEDPGTFQGFEQNVIVGRLGLTKPGIKDNLGKRGPVRQPGLGAAFFDRKSKFQGSLTREALNKILKNGKR